MMDFATSVCSDLKELLHLPGIMLEDHWHETLIVLTIEPTAEYRLSVSV